MSQIINGREIAAKIRAEVAEDVFKLRAANGRPPKLVVIQVGDNPASSTYVRNKKKACEECGIECKDIRLPKGISQFELISKIVKINLDDTVDGILVQLPLPEHINERAVVNTIDPRKDVDGFTLANTGKLLAGEDCTLPCTPAGVIELLRSTGVNLASKNAVVIGRSNIVGKPMALLLQRENMNVTMLHSKTSQEDMEFYCRHADVIVVATGRENTLTGRYFYGGKNPIIIDVGINRGADGKLHGDVSEEVKVKYSSYYSPVPMGVGPLTIAMLIRNVFRAYKTANGISGGQSVKMDTFTFFDTERDLRALTGISTNDGLWNSGFDLDDWDWGFVSDGCYVTTTTDECGCEEYVIDSAAPQYVEQILRMMENYRVGFRHNEYNGKHYYLLYHS